MANIEYVISELPVPGINTIVDTQQGEAGKKINSKKKKWFVYYLLPWYYILRYHLIIFMHDYYLWFFLCVTY